MLTTNSSYPAENAGAELRIIKEAERFVKTHPGCDRREVWSHLDEFFDLDVTDYVNMGLVAFQIIEGLIPTD